MRKLLAVLLCLAAVSVAHAKDMRRVVVAEGGGVKVQTAPIPEPQAGQVRIKVRAASVNPVDWKLAAHSPAGGTPGRDLAGVIDALGPDSGPWQIGQAVIGIPSTGAYAEYALVPVSALAAMPRRLSFDEAAGLPIAGETAWRAMVTVGAVQAGQTVLIQGGAGGVGSMAVQIAHARGAHVLATASASHTALLRRLGADEVIDYHAVRFEDRVKDVDVVLNTVDADTGARSIKVLKPGGVLVSIVGDPPADACAAAKIRCAVTGRVTGEMLKSVSDLAQEGKLSVQVDRKLSLDEVAQAWELSRQGHVGGKISLQVSR
jgi:NADPH:quinone reductase-like Zn-dependent oxidoreductase